MTHQERVQLFEQNIKQELSLLIPDNGFGVFIRELIFSHSKVVNWFIVAMLIKKHFPEKTKDIDVFLSKLSA